MLLAFRQQMNENLFYRLLSSNKRGYGRSGGDVLSFAWIWIVFVWGKALWNASFFGTARDPCSGYQESLLPNNISPQSHSCEPAHAPKQSFYHFIGGAGPGWGMSFPLLALSSFPPFRQKLFHFHDFFNLASMLPFTSCFFFSTALF